MQFVGSVGGTYLGVAPTLMSTPATADGWGATITNYDAAYTYSATTTAGTVTVSGSTVTQSGLGSSVFSTVTLTATRSGYESASGVSSGTSLARVATPTTSATTATVGGFTFTIDNYDAANTYTISTNAGSVSRSGSAITQTGLANGASATVSITASRAGFVNSATATRTGTARPACSSCTYAYTAVEGGNCGATGMCGAPNQVCCYDIIVYTGNPAGCVGCNAAVGSWYACDGTC